MNIQSIGQNRPESNQPISIDLAALREKFDRLALNLDMVNGEPTGASLVCLQCEAEELAALCQQMRDRLRGKPSIAQTGYTEEPEKISLDEVLAKQAAERGVAPMRLEADLLIQRIEQGGHSGKFLADAFLCTYRPNWFNHSLNEITKLDAEGFRLFHEILHMRHVPNWNDDELYEIEKRIRVVMGEGQKQRKRAAKSGIAKAKAGLKGQGGAV